MTLPIVRYGSSKLRKQNTDIDKNYDKINQLISDMFDTMNKAEGMGLAAPQIGKNINLFIVDGNLLADKHKELKDFKRIFINAEILKEDGKEWTYNEGCLSVPGLGIDVKRKARIKVKFLDENFNEHSEIFNKMQARIIQHEFDHIKGKLLPDYLPLIKKRMLKSKINNIIKGKVDTNYKTCS